MLITLTAEYGHYIVPKTGDTSLTQLLLKSFTFFFGTVAATYCAVEMARKIKKNKLRYYPPVRLDINGNHVL